MVTGHRGLVGSALVRRLHSDGFSNLLLRTSAELDLRNQQDVNRFFEDEKPDYVFHAAAKVGGILANNTFRADFIYDNLMIQTNVIHAAWKSGVKKLLFLGSSCIYPKHAPQPLKESYLLSGALEPTNEPYAVAKIAGIKMCDAYRAQYGCNFISVMPTNLYGPDDNFDPQQSHVLPALIRRFCEAADQQQPDVTLWGTGRPLREFMHADDLADACLFLMENYNDPGFVNIGTGKDLEIREIALLVKKITGYKGDIVHDLTKPDGTPRKQLDLTKLHSLGWHHKISLEDGIAATVKSFREKFKMNTAG